MAKSGSSSSARIPRTRPQPVAGHARSRPWWPGADVPLIGAMASICQGHFSITPLGHGQSVFFTSTGED